MEKKNVSNGNQPPESSVYTCERIAEPQGPMGAKYRQTGTYLMRFEASGFLDYLASATDACRLDDGSFYPAPWKHYGIYTQNHIVDVIAHVEPKVFYSGNVE